MTTKIGIAFGAVLLATTFAACAGPKPDYDPGITASDFVQDVTNPFFPLRPGQTWTYEEVGGASGERTQVTVQGQRRTVNGVQALVVRDTVTRGGVLMEDTFDWFAQDKNGNVWYLGEETKEYEDGKVVTTEGSWEWGVDGALPGMIMKADSKPDGEPYFQEFYWGHAVDEAAVIEKGRRVEVRAGAFTDTVTIREWTRLEKGSEEHKHYARGVGLIKEEAPDASGGMELVTRT